MIIPLKNDAKALQILAKLYLRFKDCEKGCVIMQTEPDVHEKVHKIDFASLYLSIMANTVSRPETHEHPKRTGFLASVLSSYPNLRIETKRLKRTNKDRAGIDSVL